MARRRSLEVLPAVRPETIDPRCRHCGSYQMYVTATVAKLVRLSDGRLYRVRHLLCKRCGTRRKLLYPAW